MSKTFLYYLFLNFYKDKKKHIGVILISTILIFLLSSSFFISNSIKDTLFKSLDSQADFIVQKQRGGNRVDMPLAFEEKLFGIYGISAVTPRVYGRYYFNDKLNYATIVGVDFFSDESNKNLKNIADKLNVKEFLSSNNMLVGSGVKRFLSKSFYNNSYNFLNPKGEFIKVKIYGTIKKEANFASNNLIIVSNTLAKKILGINKDMVSDFALSVPNRSEWDNIYSKIASLDYDIDVIRKDEVKKAYENLYSYKGGLFLALFLLSLVTFLLLLYYRLSTIFYSEKRDIAILRAIGWSINLVLKLKFFETLMIILISYILGVSLAYIFVYIFDAPILRDIFLGGDNLGFFIEFYPAIDFKQMLSIFIIFALPFVAVSLIPIYKIATTDPKEAMK